MNIKHPPLATTDDVLREVRTRIATHEEINARLTRELAEVRWELRAATSPALGYRCPKVRL